MGARFDKVKDSNITNNLLRATKQNNSMSRTAQKRRDAIPKNRLPYSTLTYRF